MDELTADSRATLDGFRRGTAVTFSNGRRDRLWAQTVSRARRPSSSATTAAAFLVAAAAGAAAVLLLVRPHSEIQSSPGAQWSMDDGALRITVGRLRIEPHHRRLHVVTPQLELELEGSRALVDVAPGVTVLLAEEGDVVYRTRAGAWHLKPGERVTLSDAAEAMKAAAAAPVPSCSATDAECLTRISSGSGLAAQMALYKLATSARERGALPEAIEHLRAYQRRFEGGAFAPEVSIALMLSLQASGQRDAALHESQRFLEAFRDDARWSDVAQWQATNFSEEKR